MQCRNERLCEPIGTGMLGSEENVASRLQFPWEPFGPPHFRCMEMIRAELWGKPGQYYEGMKVPTPAKCLDLALRKVLAVPKEVR